MAGQASRWRAEAALRSGKGLVRINNEDNFFLNGRFAALEDQQTEHALNVVLFSPDLLFAVCDGMGGAANGEIAAHTAVAFLPLLQKLLRDEEFTSAVRRWVSDANEQVRDAAGDGGCTLALLYLDESCVNVASLGDSRVYRLHEQHLFRLTHDHSKVQMLLDVGLIDAEQAAHHPQRHMITRYLGMDQSRVGACSPSVLRPLPIMDGDRYLLCSDGVTDMLTDAELEQLLLRGSSVEACAETIYRAALSAGGRDNLTLIVLEFKDCEYPCSGEAVYAKRPISTNEALDATETPDSTPVMPVDSGDDTLTIQHSVRSRSDSTIEIVSRISGIGSGSSASTHITLDTSVIRPGR